LCNFNVNSFKFLDKYNTLKSNKNAINHTT
jgi:hypothetical protein